MKQTKKTKSKGKTKDNLKKAPNTKFNFDEEYIIGISTPEKKTNKNNKTAKKSKTKKQKTKNKKTKEKNKKVQKSNIKKILIRFFILLILFGATASFFFLSPMFNVQEIIVENNTVIPADTVRSLSSIQLYKNIFLINKADVRKKLLSEPYIESVEISRVLPDKIRIKVTERTDKYLIEYAEGKYLVIDTQGYVLEMINEKNDLPILTGLQTDLSSLIQIDTNSEESNKNKDVPRLWKEDLKKLELVGSIVATAKNYEVYDYITRINITDDDDVILELEGEGKTVYLGDCSQLYARFDYMKTIIEAEKGKRGKIFVNGTLQDAPGQRAYFREDV